MFKIYNTSAISNKHRFYQAVAAGLIAAIVIGIFYGLFMSMIHLQSSLLFILVGYAISMVILKVGRGVQNKFAVLGAICTIIAIIIADLIMLYGLPILVMPQLWTKGFIYLLHYYLTPGINSIISVIFRLAAIGVAYQYSRIS